MKTDITSQLIQLEEHLKQHGAPDWMWPTARHARSEIQYLRLELSKVRGERDLYAERLTRMTMPPVKELR